MEPTRPLAAISDRDLLRRLCELVGQSRRIEADLVAHIAEVDERRLYAREASPSMFAYCTDVLHLSEAEAYLRIAAARASREHPVLLTMLSDGRLHLSAIVRLAPHLTPENRQAVLDRAVHRSKRRIEELVAELAPHPDVPALMRRLPVRGAANRPSEGTRGGPIPWVPTLEPRPERVSSVASPSTDAPGTAEAELRPDRVAQSRLSPASCGVEAADVPMLHADAAQTLGPEGLPDGAGALTAPARPAAASIEPLAPARYKVQFTASAELHAKLERLRALMRTSVPDGDLASIIDQAVTEKLERVEARRFAQTKTPRKSLAQTDTGQRSRHIPAAVRRVVSERDGGRCRFVDEQDRRCVARDRLEFHHVHPFGYGGDRRPENIRLVCRAHNQYLAEQDYGRRVMARHRSSGRPLPEHAVADSS